MELSEVQKVARLARLALSDEELQQSRERLTAVLDYVQLLNEVDTSGVEPLLHPVPLENVFRDDSPVASLSPDAALANACRSDGRFFLVPQILADK
ncbi:MAG: Asp-tRNA(Asn)/Glu-tRNA(Gln) amidotransferase subunit GatC [Planctomycetaceae bacterium]